jgi:hypothetical protein
MEMIVRGLLFLSCIFSGQAMATNYADPVTVTATGASTQVMAANGFRSYLLIVNSGDNTVMVKLGSVHTGTEGITLVPGGVYEPIQAPSNSVWLKTLAGTSTVTLVQGR